MSHFPISGSNNKKFICNIKQGTLNYLLSLKQNAEHAQNSSNLIIISLAITRWRYKQIMMVIIYALDFLACETNRYEQLFAVLSS